MSELKAVTTNYNGYHVTHLNGEFYPKSEADKVIKAENESLLQQNHELCQALQVMYSKEEYDKQKYKRCLAMARWCEAEVHKCLTQQGALICFPETDRFQYLQGHFMYFSRWHKRWLELAEKFKEVK